MNPLAAKLNIASAFAVGTNANKDAKPKSATNQLVTGLYGFTAENRNENNGLNLFG
ncbi:MAG: hypothetical protein KC476_05360 [Cyanobacteria bacterium HKST-UBA06]|nr:hypothetical protein [Cyanobacteria bacterium HKST-UBA04]MCA9807366.1 hypothetical protein [Cyanobacteria bacterium HKST-UBA06]MCA9840582.1 hypothetical protein [Cyanobacteria bacterium HKST-UBA03]